MRVIYYSPGVYYFGDRWQYLQYPLVINTNDYYSYYLFVKLTKIAYFKSKILIKTL
jgi:hypothetical protein